MDLEQFNVNWKNINKNRETQASQRLLKEQQKQELNQALQKLLLNASLKNKQTSISISERPYSEMQKAREVLQRSPADYGKAGMAKKVGGSFLGIPTGGGFGSRWEMNPEARAEQEGAQTILGNPTRTTKRISYKGGVVDTEGTDVTNQLPDPTDYEEGTIIEDESGQQYKVENGEWVTQ